MAVCDASLLVTNLVVNWPGSAHDSRIFNESQLCPQSWLPSWWWWLSMPFLPPYSLCHSQGHHMKKKFNQAHIRTRNCVERMFGILKMRFSILATPLRTKLALRSDVIVATFVLHNIAIRNKLSLEEGLEVRAVENVPELNHQENAASGNTRRAEIAARFFPKACSYMWWDSTYITVEFWL